MALEDFFAPGRVHTNQDGAIVLPDNAQIRMHGGHMTLGDRGNLDFPQFCSPMVLRFPIGASTFTFTKFLGFNYYVLDVWAIKNFTDGGLGDEIDFTKPQAQGGEKILRNPLDLNVPKFTVVRAPLIERAHIGESAAAIPQELQLSVTNAVDVTCFLYLMVAAYQTEQSGILS